jgi:hypothetical protein
MARALFDWPVNHERRGFDEERALPVGDIVDPARILDRRE